MVNPVVTAECWQTLYELRRTMLAEGYSALPWRDGNDWLLVTADWLAKCLMEVENRVQLETELRCVPNKPLPLPSTQLVCPDTKFGCIPPKTSLVLEHDVLVGIITPVDLLRTGPFRPRESRSRAP